MTQLCLSMAFSWNLPGLNCIIVYQIDENTGSVISMWLIDINVYIYKQFTSMCIWYNLLFFMQEGIKSPTFCININYFKTIWVGLFRILFIIQPSHIHYRSLIDHCCTSYRCVIFLLRLSTREHVQSVDRSSSLCKGFRN